MKQEKSCGVVPYIHDDTGIHFLIIKHHAGHWGFPKGRQEAGESDLQTALRELQEETGLIPSKVLDDSLVDHYKFTKNNELIEKTVIYYLVEVQNKEVTLQQEEVSDYSWGDLNSTKNLLTHDQAKIVLQKAHDEITKAYE
jgi:bis(5'-nucleosidyl)-tetraphosphatase